MKRPCQRPKSEPAGCSSVERSPLRYSSKRQVETALIRSRARMAHHREQETLPVSMSG